mgnify:FL=1
MLKRIFTGAVAGVLCFALTACQPSEEKITQAKEKYGQLTEAHNQVVEAHKKVTDTSLDEELMALKEKAGEIEDYNLAEMKDEEIDRLIGTMDSMIADYEEYLAALSEIRQKEEEAVLTSITLALTNQTGFTFSKLIFHEKGDKGAQVNVLEDMGALAPDQSLTGLIIQRDVDHTPWVLVLSDESGKEFTIELSVGEYPQEGVSLLLSYDEEQDEILVS